MNRLSLRLAVLRWHLRWSVVEKGRRRLRRVWCFVRRRHWVKFGSYPNCVECGKEVRGGRL
jgi:hypothetical protein